MTDAQRFIRYATPGLTYGVVSLGLLLLLNPDWTIAGLNTLNKKDAGLSVALATFLVSGGAGFLFSVLHHHWHWSSRSTVIDHSFLISQLVKKDRITLVNAVTRDKLPKETTIDRNLSWLILTSLWHERLDSTSPLKPVNQRASGLTDLAHSAGTGRVATIAACATAAIIACCVSGVSLTLWPIVRFIIAIAVASGLLYVQHKNYVRVGALAQGFIEQTFSNNLGAKTVQASVVAIHPDGEVVKNECVGMCSSALSSQNKANSADAKSSAADYRPSSNIPKK